jgi:hypothetical protein
MTIFQRAEAIAIIEALLGAGMHKHKIFAVFKIPWGEGKYAPLSARTCGALLTRAKGNLRAAVRSGAAGDDPRLRTYVVYNSVLRDPAATPRERILAQARIDRLLGLGRPAKLNGRIDAEPGPTP